MSIFKRFAVKNNFIIIDNNDAKEDVFTAVFKRIKKLANRKIQNKRAQQWINMELQKKTEGERGTLGTGRIARTRRRVADPKRVADIRKGGMQQFLRRT